MSRSGPVRRIIGRRIIPDDYHNDGHDHGDGDGDDDDDDGDDGHD